MIASFVACAPGLEPLLADDIGALELGALKIVPGGVELETDLAGIYRLNLELGVALRVLVRVASFEARRFPELVRQASAVPWEEWIGKGAAVDLRVKAAKSKLFHTGAIAERLREGIAARLGGEVAEGEDLAVQVRFEHDRCTLSLDTSGDILSHRGWRDGGASAPLREDLALALVRISGWNGDTPLIDPFTGSGTIAIEAAQLAARLPPGRLRTFAFERMPNHDAALWKAIRARSLAKSRPLPVPILAGDRSADAIGVARVAAERAGLGAIEFAVQPFTDSLGRVQGERGAVVGNPPFGRRLGSRDEVYPLYRSLGEQLARLPTGWRAAFVVDDQRLGRALGNDFASAVMTDHGGHKVWMLRR